MGKEDGISTHYLCWASLLSLSWYLPPEASLNLPSDCLLFTPTSPTPLHSGWAISRNMEPLTIWPIYSTQQQNTFGAVATGMTAVDYEIHCCRPRIRLDCKYSFLLLLYEIWNKTWGSHLLFSNQETRGGLIKGLTERFWAMLVGIAWN